MAASVLSQLSNPLIAAPLILLCGALIVFIIFRKTSLSFSGETFEKESLENMIKPEFTGILQKFGKKNYSRIRRDLKTISEAYREVRFTEPNDYNTDDSDVNHIKEVSIDLDDIVEIDDLVKAGYITTEQKKNIEKNQIVPHRFIQTRPHKSLSKIFWLFSDKLLGRESYTDYFLIPEIVIKDNPGDGSISIKRNVEFRPLAGLYVPLYESSLGILRSVTMRSMYKQALEDQANYHEKVNFFDAQFSQILQQIDAEAEAEKKKYQTGATSDANQG